MDYEEKLLTLLVEHYRRSKKDSGENKTNRRTQVKPEKLYKKYNANDGEPEEILKINRIVEELTELGFITSTRETFGTQIQCIYLVDGKIADVEQYMARRYGYCSKDMQLGKLKKLVAQYQKASPMCEKECARLEKCIEDRKVPKNIDGLENILKAVTFIEKNRECLYIREASMKIYGDSKYFEDNTIEPVCNILWKYSGRALKKDKLADEILLDYCIAKEPQKLCIKGKAVITIAGREVDISGFSEGVEFLVSDLGNIQSVQLCVPRFMTIENRASYLRYRNEEIVTFYLGGYANRYQRDFIKKIYASNASACYMHFGDIDAGGFWIHHNLCEVTGVGFQLFSMSVRELQNGEYSFCLHELTGNDRTRLRKLRGLAAYEEVVQYMLEHNVKLEQEIVCLDLMKKGRDRSKIWEKQKN